MILTRSRARSTAGLNGHGSPLGSLGAASPSSRPSTDPAFPRKTAPALLVDARRRANEGRAAHSNHVHARGSRTLLGHLTDCAVDDSTNPGSFGQRFQTRMRLGPGAADSLHALAWHAARASKSATDNASAAPSLWQVPWRTSSRHGFWRIDRSKCTLAAHGACKAA